MAEEKREVKGERGAIDYTKFGDRHVATKLVFQLRQIDEMDGIIDVIVEMGKRLKKAEYKLDYKHRLLLFQGGKLSEARRLLRTSWIMVDEQALKTVSNSYKEILLKNGTRAIAIYRQLLKGWELMRNDSSVGRIIICQDVVEYYRHLTFPPLSVETQTEEKIDE